MVRQKISIGLPYYGSFQGEWVSQTIQILASLSMSHTIREVISLGTMTADHSRNAIANAFLKTDSEWLFWIDSDTLVPAGGIERLLSTGQTLVSGLYYGKNPPHNPIAYYTHNGGFTPIDKWEKGDLINVDAVGFGCMLTHRSVFEDIQKNFTVLQIPGGGLVPVHNNDLIGSIVTTEGKYHTHEHDGKVYRGQLRQRLIQPTLQDMRWPFFQIQYNRTEDFTFFELAAKVGHKPVLDSSVECTHLRFHGFGGKDYRDLNGR